MDVDDDSKPIVRVCALCRRPATLENPIVGPGICSECSQASALAPPTSQRPEPGADGRFLPQNSATMPKTP